MSSPWVLMARTLGLVPHYAHGSLLAAEGWQDLRRRVGLPIRGDFVLGNGDVLMAGAWRGTPAVVAQSTIFRTRRDQSNAHVAQVFAAIEPPLHLGLSVQPQGSSGGGAHLPDLRIGEPAFDASYHLFAGEPELVRPLFARSGEAPELVDYLTDLARQGVDVDIVDDRVRLYVWREVLNPQTFSAWLDGAVWIARRLQQASRGLPRSGGREAFQHALHELARPLGLEVTPEPMAHGIVAGAEVWVHLSSARGRLTTTLAARLPSPVVQGLRIVKQSDDIPERDMLLGFPALDAALRIQGAPERDLRVALLPLQERLLRASRLTERFSVEDGLVRVVLAGAAHGAPALEAALQEIVAIALGLSNAGAAAPPQAPYR